MEHEPEPRFCECLECHEEPVPGGYFCKPHWRQLPDEFKERLVMHYKGALWGTALFAAREWFRLHTATT